MAKTEEQRMETRYIRHLKKEIAKLKRENQQLRKKIRRHENEEMQDEFEEYISPEFIEIKEKQKFECPRCGSYDISKFKSGAFEFYKCDCGSKGRLDKANKAS